MGIAVVGGMIFATSLGVFLIPVFFVMVETLAASLGFSHKVKKTTSDDLM